MRRIIPLLALCLLAAAARAQAPPSLEQLIQTQRDVRDTLSHYTYQKHLRMETLDEGGAVTGERAGSWSVYRRPDGRPKLKRIALSGPGLKRLKFPRGEALRDALEGLTGFFARRCGTRLVGADGDLWKFRTWATEDATQERPCFDGLVWVTREGVAVKATGRPSPAYRFYDGVEHRYARGVYTMDARGFPLKVEGEDWLTFHTVFEGGLPLRVRVRHLTLYSEYVTMHSHEPVVIEEGEPGEVPEPR
jgi:hypothetical protein